MARRAPSEEIPPLEGVTLGGRFRLARQIGEGPLGALYEAKDDHEGAFAVKVISRARVSDEALSRFIRSASLIAAAPVNRFVPVIDVGHDLARDLVFIVTPYLPSGSLAALLTAIGPLPPRVALRLALETAVAVAELHAIDVVHRNLKPSNLFPVPLDDGSLTLRLADHGIGRARIGDGASMETSSSLEYVAPEQLGGPRAADRRTDVHGLGITLYELLSGVTPWREARTSGDLVSAIASRNPPLIQERAPWIGASIGAVVDRAIRLDPQRRFPSAEAFAQAIRALIEGSERLTRAMLVPLDAATRSTVAARVVGHGGDAFAPTMATEDGAPAIADDWIGHRLGGRYVITRLLGRGGMGAVYEAENGAGARFAAKVILHDLSERQVASVARFLREGRAVTKIQDPHVTRTLELGTDMKRGAPFMIMELLTGRDLGAIVKERGALATIPVLRVFLQAARGLASAHRQGIVHRDVKPANIFLHLPAAGEAITVKICDFGLAKSIEEALGERPSHDLTRSGGMLGTPYYMSPEHATNAKSVDARADVWSLSASLFEALTGRRLWGEPASLGELLATLCAREPRRLGEVAPAIDPAVAAVVDRGLRRDVRQRWESMDAMIAALEPLVGGTERVTLGELASIDPASLGVNDDPAPFGAITRAPARLGRAAETLFTPPEQADGAMAREAQGTAPPLARETGTGALRPRRGNGATALTAAALAAAIAGGAFVARKAHEAGRVSPPDFGSALSPNPAAAAAYHAAIQAWRDGALDASEPKLEEATRLDPSFAAAHLRAVTLASDPAGARVHAKTASQLRGSLSEHDRALLDAYLPWTDLPSDAEQAERRLVALVKQQPRDADYAYALCRMRVLIGDFAGAEVACDQSARSDAHLLDALRLKAFSIQARGDEASAIMLDARCAETSHVATACLADFSHLQMSAGRCEDSVGTARKWAALEPVAWAPQQTIAYGLQGSGQPMLNVVEVLRTHVWAPMDPAERAPDEAQVFAAFDILAGDFRGADTRIEAWDRALAQSDDEWSHLLLSLWKVTLLVETGRNTEAESVAADFFRRRSAWTPTQRDLSIYLRAIQLRLGSIDDAAWAKLRDAWLESRPAALKQVKSRAIDWSYAYAYSARNEQDAIAALEALPRFLPLTGGMLRSPDFDEAIARVYLLARRPAEALPFAERAARTCYALDHPVESVRALFLVGGAQEALGEAGKACEAYAGVVARWGNEPRSITANEARLGQARLGCSAR